jgi:cobalt-zinc-cadmium efflux system protein
LGENKNILKTNTKVLTFVILLNLLIVALQIAFGIFSHSLALITDAVHNFQDVISLIIALVAAVWMTKEPTEKMTFGFLRSEAMAGFINSGFLIGAIFLIVISGIERLLNPQEIDGIYVIVMGGIALIINGWSAYLLGFHHSHGHGYDDHHHNYEDLNIKAAYLHLLSDAGISLGVVIGGLFIYFYKIYWIDPVLSIVFSLYILKETIPVLKKTSTILMEGMPYEINLKELENKITDITDVEDVHDIHIWALSSKDIYFTGHIVVSKDLTLEQISKIIEEVEKILKDYGINHITIQAEPKDFKCENVY